MNRHTKKATIALIAISALLGTGLSAFADKASVFDKAIERPEIEIGNSTDEMFTRKFEFARNYSSEFHKHADESIRKAIANAKIMIDTDIESALRYANQTGDSHAVDILGAYKTNCDKELNRLAEELRKAASLDEIVQKAKASERDIEVDKAAIKANIKNQVDAAVDRKTNEQLSRLLAI